MLLDFFPDILLATANVATFSRFLQTSALCGSLSSTFLLIFVLESKSATAFLMSPLPKAPLIVCPSAFAARIYFISFDGTLMTFPKIPMTAVNSLSENFPSLYLSLNLIVINNG